MQDDINPITEGNLHEHFGDSGYQIKQVEDEREDDLQEELDEELAGDSESPWPEEGNPEDYEGYSFTTNAREDDPSPFAEYIYKFTQRHYPEQLVSLSEVRKVRTRASALFIRKSPSETLNAVETVPTEPLTTATLPTETLHIGQLSLRGILMKAMRTEAEHVIIQPHRHHPTLTHSITTGQHGVVEMLEPAHRELMAYLASLPSPHLRFNLDTLLDEFLAEYEMANDLAREYVAWYRAAATKEFQVLLALNMEKQKAILELKPIQPK